MLVRWAGVVLAGKFLFGRAWVSLGPSAVPVWYQVRRESGSKIRYGTVRGEGGGPWSGVCTSYLARIAGFAIGVMLVLVWYKKPLCPVMYQVGVTVDLGVMQLRCGLRRKSWVGS